MNWRNGVDVSGNLYKLILSLLIHRYIFLFVVMIPNFFLSLDTSPWYTFDLSLQCFLKTNILFANFSLMMNGTSMCSWGSSSSSEELDNSDFMSISILGTSKVWLRVLPSITSFCFSWGAFCFTLLFCVPCFVLIRWSIRSSVLSALRMTLGDLECFFVSSTLSVLASGGKSLILDLLGCSLMRCYEMWDKT